MDIKELLRPLQKWWWLILAAMLLASISTYVVSSRQPPIYEARTTLAVGRTIFDPNPSSGDLYLGQQLASVYANFAQRGQVQQATKDALDLAALPEHVIRVLPNTQFLEISVKDTIPERAQTVANELAHQLMLLSPTDPQQADQDRQAFVQEQLDYLEIKIEETKGEIDQAQIELAEMTSARQIADAQDTISALQDKLTALQSNYAALLADSREEAANIISIIEPAAVPTQPVGPSQMLLVALSAVIGFSLGAGAAYLLENVDDTVKTPDDVKRILDLPILGYIPQTKQLASSILLLKEPYSSDADAFRLLKTNMEFAWGQKKPKSILVTSLGPGHGKTTVAANLAAAYAQGGKEVVLVDADLRRPNVHRYAQIPNEVGLSDVLKKGLDPTSLSYSVSGSPLSILTSGTRIANPVEILDSDQLIGALVDLEEHVDFVIFDSPPLPLPDSMVLASTLDAVIVVLRPGKVRKRDAMTSMEQLSRSRANLLGVVLNCVARGAGYDYVMSLYGYRGVKQDTLIETRITSDEPDETDALELITSPQSGAERSIESHAKAIFLDRDGVIIENRSSYVRSWEDVKIIPGVLDALARVSKHEHKIIIVTNQSAIGRGIISYEEAEEINQKLVRVIEGAGGRVDGIYMCPHHPRQGCNCRKPKPGLLLSAADSFSLNLSESIMIGDAWSDIEAGRAAGVSKLMLVQTGRGADQASLSSTLNLGENVLICKSLVDALDTVMSTQVQADIEEDYVG